MRTTIDLPDDLFRKAKAIAALRGVSLKDLITNSLLLSLDSGGEGATEFGRKTPLPNLFTTKDVIPSMTSAEIEELIYRREIEGQGPDRTT